MQNIFYLLSVYTISYHDIVRCLISIISLQVKHFCTSICSNMKQLQVQWQDLAIKNKKSSWLILLTQNRKEMDPVKYKWKKNSVTSFSIKIGIAENKINILSVPLLFFTSCLFSPLNTPLWTNLFSMTNSLFLITEILTVKIIWKKLISGSDVEGIVNNNDKSEHTLEEIICHSIPLFFSENY